MSPSASSMVLAGAIAGSRSWRSKSASSSSRSIEWCAFGVREEDGAAHDDGERGGGEGAGELPATRRDRRGRAIRCRAHATHDRLALAAPEVFGRIGQRRIAQLGREPAHGLEVVATGGAGGDVRFDASGVGGRERAFGQVQVGRSPRPSPRSWRRPRPLRAAHAARNVFSSRDLIDRRQSAT
jgi:hypothetical protein